MQNEIVDEFLETYCNTKGGQDFTFKLEFKILLDVFLDCMIDECANNDKMIAKRIATLGTEERMTQRKYYKNASAFLSHCKMRIRSRFARHILYGKVEQVLSSFNPNITNDKTTATDII